jgi:hypothetical protein
MNLKRQSFCILLSKGPIKGELVNGLTVACSLVSIHPVDCTLIGLN